MDITKLELWELWKMKFEQLAALTQAIMALDAEIARREKLKAQPIEPPK